MNMGMRKEMQSTWLRLVTAEPVARPEHIACDASTCPGKGVVLMIPNRLMYGASLVCLDVKEEVFPATAGTLELAGHNVIMFDPSRRQQREERKKL